MYPEEDVHGQPHHEQHGQVPEELADPLGGDVAVEAQQERQVEGGCDEDGVEHQEPGLALPARHPPERGLVHPSQADRHHAAARRDSRARTTRHSAAKSASATANAVAEATASARQAQSAAAVSAVEQAPMPRATAR